MALEQRRSVKEEAVILLVDFRGFVQSISKNVAEVLPVVLEILFCHFISFFSDVLIVEIQGVKSVLKISFGIVKFFFNSVKVFPV